MDPKVYKIIDDRPSTNVVIQDKMGYWTFYSHGGSLFPSLKIDKQEFNGVHKEEWNRLHLLVLFKKTIPELLKDAHKFNKYRDSRKRDRCKLYEERLDLEESLDRIPVEQLTPEEVEDHEERYRLAKGKIKIAYDEMVRCMELDDDPNEILFEDLEKDE